jgi:hypothetical protein
MFERKDKRRIYQLINMYLAGKISENTFCDDFVPTYHQELDYDTLTEEEHKAFSELGIIAARFSDIIEDLIMYPGVYYTKLDLKKKIVETHEKLKDYFNDFQEDKEELLSPIPEIRDRGLKPNGTKTYAKEFHPIRMIGLMV